MSIQDEASAPAPQRLRDAQTELTRNRLLDAAIEHIAADGSEAMTIRSVAARSGVSVPTAYRYFPSRDDLLDAVARRIDELSRFEDFAGSLDGCAEYVRVLFPIFNEHPDAIRAMLALPAIAEVRSRRSGTRMALIRRSVAESLPDASAEAVERAAAVIHLVLSISAWSHLHDRWGLDGERTTGTAAWALEVLVAALREDPERIARSSAHDDEEGAR